MSTKFAIKGISAYTTIRVGFQEPKFHSDKADKILDATLASRLQLAMWYDEPSRYCLNAIYGEGCYDEKESFTELAAHLGTAAAKDYIKQFRTGIRREFDARAQAKASTRVLISKSRRTVTYITDPIDKFRSMIHTTRKPLDF